jgi:predicted transcriptional regulator
MSSRAAARLETLGFDQVFEYKPGKKDWEAAALPMAGGQAQQITAVEVLRRNIPTAHIGEHVGDVLTRAEAAGWNVCIVVNSKNQVLGRLRRGTSTVDPGARVEDVTEEGPTTYRPSKDLAILTQRMRSGQVSSVLITDPDGVLIGALYRQDAERRLSQVANEKGPAEQTPLTAK